MTLVEPGNPEKAQTGGELARRLLMAVGAGVVALLLILMTVSLAYLVRISTDANRAAQEVADCTTPHGVCYERGRTATAAAVEQILDQLNTLESQRNVTSASLQAQIADLRHALARLCAAQGITCPSVTP